jgi:superfamily II DNA helicase RecQ
MHKSGGWIVAIGALEIGINIKGIVYVIHVDWPYGLTSFVQQLGHGGRNGEVSDSIIIARVQHSSKHKWKEVTSEYSVESVDEEAIAAFMQSWTCRRRVLSHYLDRESSEGDYNKDSVFCDHCKVYNHGRIGQKGEEVKGGYKSKPDGEQDREHGSKQDREQGSKQDEEQGRK